MISILNSLLTARTIQAYAAIGIGLISNGGILEIGENSGPISGFKTTHRKQRGARLDASHSYGFEWNIKKLVFHRMHPTILAWQIF